MKIAQHLLVGVALAVLPAWAFATSITLDNPTATFHDTVGGSNHQYSSNGCTGATDCEVRWGTPVGNTDASGLRFDSFTAPLNTNTGTAFNLGDLTHFNWPVNGGTAASGTQLSFGFTITDPNLGPQTFLFSFNIDETPNETPCVYPSNTPCADKITFGNATSTTVFNINGDVYTLYLLGFGSDANNLSNEFITQENLNNVTSLWAKIDLYQQPVGVPEPNALLMMALGLFGIGMAVEVRRRKRRTGTGA